MSYAVSRRKIPRNASGVFPSVIQQNRLLTHGMLVLALALAVLVVHLGKILSARNKELPRSSSTCTRSNNEGDGRCIRSVSPFLNFDCTRIRFRKLEPAALDIEPDGGVLPFIYRRTSESPLVGALQQPVLGIQTSKGLFSMPKFPVPFHHRPGRTKNEIRRLQVRRERKYIPTIGRTKKSEPNLNGRGFQPKSTMYARIEWRT